MAKKVLVTSGQPAASGISIDIQTNVVSGPGPLVVWFDASATTAPGVTYPLHELIYLWDFDDTGAGSWSVGHPLLTDKNSDIGFIAGHVFESAGTYDVTLTVYDATGTNAPASSGVTITVTDRDTWYTQTGREIVYVSNTNDFSGAIASGPHANGGTVTHLNTTSWATAINSIAVNKLVLFRRGETWTSSASKQVQTTGAWWGVGTFASGNAPVVTCSSAAFTIGDYGGPWPANGVIADLKLTGSPGSCIDYVGGATEVSLLRVEITDCGDKCVDMSYNSCDNAQTIQGGASNGSGTLFTGCHFVECNFHGASVGHSTQWLSWNCQKSLLLGTIVDRTIDGAEPMLRSWFNQKNGVAHCYFAHCPEGKDVVKLNGWQQYVSFASANTSTEEVTISTAYNCGTGNTFINVNDRVIAREVSPGSLPDPLVDGNTYWVVGVSGTYNRNVQLGLTRGGAAIDLTTDGSGQLWAYPSFVDNTYIHTNYWYANELRVGKGNSGWAIGKSDSDDAVRGSQYDVVNDSMWADLYMSPGDAAVTNAILMKGYHERVTVRNLIFLSRYQDSFSSHTLWMQLPSYLAPMGPVSKDVWFDGITGYLNKAGTTGKLWGLTVTDNRTHTNVRVRNFLLVSLSASAAEVTVLNDDSLSVNDDGGHYTRKGTPGTVFVSSDPTTPSEFRLAASSPAIAQGVDASTTYFDTERRVRGATVDSGAMEYAGV